MLSEMVIGLPVSLYNGMVTIAMRNAALNSEYQPRKDVPIHLRHPEDVDTREFELKPLKYIALALVHLKESFARVPVMLEDNSRPVDVYEPQIFVNSTQTQQVTLQPQWETGERIKFIVITGPPNAVTLQLGDRFWPLTIPASGFISIGPMALLLSRQDQRILWSATAGAYSLELMGNADSRGQML